MIELRPYQKDALEKIMWAKTTNLQGNNVIVLPTGAGKSIIVAELAHRLKEPVLILQPSREILSQNLEKLLRYVDRSEVGIYSASMDEKTIGFYTLATIQSIYKRPEFFKHFRTVIIDECHLVNPKNLKGMFTKFLDAIGDPQVFGLTATPYRIATRWFNYGTDFARVSATTKLINRMNGFFWQRFLFNINVEDLINLGFLCPLEYIDRSIVEQANIPVNNTRTDFDLGEYEKMILSRELEIHKTIAYGQSFAKSVLVFCSSVGQATRLSSATPSSAVVSAKTPKKERDAIIKAFRNHEIQTVFNMGVLTLGFDHPALDCIILLRPTRSIGLYYQMLGRGVRVAPGKTTCKVIDLTSTVKKLGRIETIKLVKQDKWELISETGSWHDKELYDFYFKKKPSALAGAALAMQ